MEGLKQTSTVRANEARGYQVMKAATSVAAFQIAITKRTDIVVTDVRLTGSMTGLELTRRLRIHGMNSK